MKEKGRIAAWYVSKFNFSNRQATTSDLVLRSRFANDAGMPAEKQHPHVLKHSIASHLVSANINLAPSEAATGSQINRLHDTLCNDERPASF
jgi:hypothetical protein